MQHPAFKIHMLRAQPSTTDERNTLEKLRMYLPTKCLERREFGSIQIIATYYSSLKQNTKGGKKRKKRKEIFSIQQLHGEEFGTWVNCTRHITPGMTNAKQGQLQVKATCFCEWGF